MSLCAKYSIDGVCDGILSVGDVPFPLLLPEPLSSVKGVRIYTAFTNLEYDESA